MHFAFPGLRVMYDDDAYFSQKNYNLNFSDIFNLLNGILINGKLMFTLNYSKLFQNHQYAHSLFVTLCNDKCVPIVWNQIKTCH